MTTLRKVLEEIDVERKRLAQLVRAQESQLQHVLNPSRKLTTDEHQLQRHLDILCGILDLKRKLSDAEDEHHITATTLKILQEQSICSQKQAITLVSVSSSNPVRAYLPTTPNPLYVEIINIDMQLRGMSSTFHIMPA